MKGRSSSRDKRTGTTQQKLVELAFLDGVPGQRPGQRHEAADAGEERGDEDPDLGLADQVGVAEGESTRLERVPGGRVYNR